MSSSTPTPATASFSLRRIGLDLRFRRVELESREWLNDRYVRVRLAGDELAGFDSPGADDHIRVFFPAPGAGPRTVDELRAAPSREYTPLAWSDTHLDIEFAIHTDAAGTPQGEGAAWAASAPLGSRAGVGGPRGSLVIDGAPEGWLLAGDETAVPAMRRYAAAMPHDASGRIIVEVADAAHELPIDAPAGVTVEQLHRGTAGGAPEGRALAARLDALGAGDRPAGDVFAFVAAEQQIVRPARALLAERWGLSPERFVAKGYWKRGEAEYHAPH